LRKYDDYAKMMRVFVENGVGLDYLEKRVKRADDGDVMRFCFVVKGLEEVRKGLLDIGGKGNKWEYGFNKSIMINIG